MRIYTTLLLLIFIFFSENAFGQTEKAYQKKAEEAYIQRDYTGALAYYQELIEIDSNQIDALFYAGESARQIRAFSIADKHLTRIPDSLKTGMYYTTDFRIANVKKGLEEYEEAIGYYEQFIEKNVDATNPFIKRALAELDYCRWADNVLKEPLKTQVTHLDTTINTYHIDFAPYKKEGVLYYSSAYSYQEKEGNREYINYYGRGKGGNRDAYDNRDLVTRVYGYDELQKERVILPFALKNNEHVSHTSFSEDAMHVFYTICQNKKDTVGEYLCQIYYRDKDAAGHWKSPKLLPARINLPNYTATQPCVATKEDGSQILLFASNRPGGKGNLDLYVSKITVDSVLKFSSPQPLTNLNTEYDDISPYYHSNSQTLFFSSEGHKTLGGFDIFKTKKEIFQKEGTEETVEQWAAPQNIGYPINSSYDDMYYMFSSEEEKSYFASNRPGSMCKDPEKGCTCTDIYEGTILVNLNTLVYNSIDSSALEGVELKLTNLETMEVDTIQMNNNGSLFDFPLKLESKYHLNASKPDYDPAGVVFNTKGIIESTTIEKKLYLIPQINLLVLTYDGISKLPLNGTTIRLHNDLMNTDSFVTLPETTNQAKYKIDFKKDYAVYCSKNSYSTANDAFDTYLYSTPTNITIELYLNTFNLPLTLYFDNDQPRYARTSADTTVALTYGETYDRYIERQPTFKNSYTKNLTGTLWALANDEIDNFFRDEVVKGWNDLQGFSGLLLPYLKAGNEIDIIVEGYASPLADSLYNERLTKRRISSVINQLSVWSNGELSDYLARGVLVVKEEPKGEDMADKKISDNKQNQRASIFSPIASHERRVLITDVRQQESMMSWLEKEK
ncbi:MAG: tetratricopeptide (TPR) repeat protein [Paraglaciecola sp.]|jgi:tetratricopeptide (TPR) repeat protein